MTQDVFSRLAPIIGWAAVYIGHNKIPDGTVFRVEPPYTDAPDLMPESFRTINPKFKIVRAQIKLLAAKRPACKERGK